MFRGVSLFLLINSFLLSYEGKGRVVSIKQTGEFLKYSYIKKIQSVGMYSIPTLKRVGCLIALS